MNRPVAARRGLPALLGVFAGAALLALIPGAAHGLGDLAWHWLTLASALAVVLLAWLAPSGGRVWLRRLLLAAAALLALLTVAVGSGLLGAFSPGGRVALFVGNPNILGANLVVLALAVLVVERSKRVLLLLPVSALATLYTGSRTALVALAVALLAYGLLTPGSRRRRLALLLIPLGLAALVAVSLGEGDNPNLLRFSDRFTHAAWRRDAAELSLAPGGPGPGAIAAGDAGTAARPARRLRARDGGHGYPDLLLYQSVERSQPGVPYVASVYLRADPPQTLVLSSNLTDRVCRATPSWSRCATPPARGNGRTFVQLQLRALDPEQHLDVELWGAQVEVGERPTAAVTSDRRALLVYVPDRLDPRVWFVDPVNSPRLEAMAAAWRLFSQRPLAGVGHGGFAASVAASPTLDSAVAHPHNAALQLLAEGGLAGLLAQLLPLLALPALTGGWRRAAPLLIAVLVLNSVDATLFTVGSYYPLWLALALLATPAVAQRADARARLDATARTPRPTQLR